MLSDITDKAVKQELAENLYHFERQLPYNQTSLEGVRLLKFVNLPNADLLAKLNRLNYREKDYILYTPPLPYIWPDILAKFRRSFKSVYAYLYSNHLVNWPALIEEAMPLERLCNLAALGNLESSIMILENIQIAALVLALWLKELHPCFNKFPTSFMTAEGIIDEVKRLAHKGISKATMIQLSLFMDVEKTRNPAQSGGYAMGLVDEAGWQP
ncbi:hypothetical protein H1R20_g11420, partial [Candolleomyces eurysporus]